MNPLTDLSFWEELKAKYSQKIMEHTGFAT